MGGNALKCPTRRLEADQYHALAAQVADDIAREFEVRTHVVRAYRNKQDFGDLDLVVERAGALEGPLDDPWTPDIGNAPVPDSEVIARIKAFTARYHTRDVYRERNSPVLSFEHRSSPNEEAGFQVDMILAPEVDFQASCDYFAYNDLGNLVGRMAHAMGCKYGFNGMSMKVMDDTQQLGIVCLSKDTRVIHEALGLDHDRFLAGFDCMDDVFDFVMSSTLFHPELYKLENAGYRERTRDRKRVNYSAFLDRCQTLDVHAYIAPDSERVSQWMQRHFPDAAGQEQAIRQSHEQRKSLSAWFNGHTVGQWTGLQGKALGEVIKQLREDARDETTLAQWGPEEVRRRAVEMVHQQAPGQRNKRKP